MATMIPMVRNADGVTTPAYSGFSWTTLLFSAFPALFRGHILAFFAQLIAPLLTFGLSFFVFPFVYNKWHRAWLVGKGFVPAHQAAAVFGNVQESHNIINVHVGDSSQASQQINNVEGGSADLISDNQPADQDQISEDKGQVYLPPINEKTGRGDS